MEKSEIIRRLNKAIDNLNTAIATLAIFSEESVQGETRANLITQRNRLENALAAELTENLEG